jgi:hypothetical protein
MVGEAVGAGVGFATDTNVTAEPTLILLSIPVLRLTVSSANVTIDEPVLLLVAAALMPTREEVWLNAVT